MKTNYHRVEQLEHANQFVILGDGEIIFQSYNSIIAVYTTDSPHTLTLGRDWDYSKTTLVHLYLFIERYIWNVRGVAIDSLIADSRNKKQTIEKLIKRGIIDYDHELR